jgi:tRNA-2-methylthio-N6-dimethylallyladenosine synthase
LAKLRKQNNFLNIVVVGCIASYKKQEFYSRFPFISFVTGAKDDKNLLQEKLVDIVLSIETSKQIKDLNYQANNLSENNISKNTNILKLKKFNLRLGGIKVENRHSIQSFVNIMTGCNNFCTYCIVPFTRGREVSYKAKDILEKIKYDLSMGAKEITLIGQNVNSYKDPESNLNFAQLLKSIALIDGDFWIRFMSPHPKDMTLDVINIMAQYQDKICGFVHHPVQSGSNKIIEAMNRSYTVEKYLEQIDWIKKYLPKATISTDIIVGFPGETEADFMETVKLVETVNFDNVYSFIFSPRKYTKAALMPDLLSYDEKQKRLDFLQKIQINISKSKHEAYIGHSLKCLVEKPAVNGMLLARSAGNHTVLFDGSDSLINSFVKIKIESAGAANLTGSLIK